MAVGLWGLKPDQDLRSGMMGKHSLFVEQKALYRKKLFEQQVEMQSLASRPSYQSCTTQTNPLKATPELAVDELRNAINSLRKSTGEPLRQIKEKEDKLKSLIAYYYKKN